MGKLLEFLGYFLLGVSIVGLFAYTGYAVAESRIFLGSMLAIAIILFITGFITDDWMADRFNLQSEIYLGYLIWSVVGLIVGVLCQFLGLLQLAFGTN